MDKFNIFISYAWIEDNENYMEAIIRLYDSLTENYKLRVWLDRKILNVGRPIFEHLRIGIQNSDLFLCCVTKQYVASRTCNMEVNYAVNRGKMILPLRFDDTPLNELQALEFILVGLNLFYYDVYRYPELLNSWTGDKFQPVVRSIFDQLQLPIPIVTVNNQIAPPPNFEIKSSLIDNCNTWVIRMKVLPNKKAYAGLKDGKFKIYDLNEGKLLKAIQAHAGHVWDFDHYKNQLLLTVSEDKTAKSWENMGEGKCKKTYTYTAAMCTVCTLPDDKFATGARDSAIIIWNVNTAEKITQILGHSLDVYGLVYLSNGSLASSSGDAKILIWDLNTYREIQKLTEHSELIFDLRKLENEHLISSCDDYTAKIWNPRYNKSLLTFKEHKHFVNGTSELPNGYIVSSSEDKTVKIWDKNNGTCKQTIVSHNHPVWGMESKLTDLNKVHVLTGDTIGRVFFNVLNI